MTGTPRSEAGRRFVPHRLIRPIATFVHTEASGGLVLLVAALAALAWANSPWQDGYFDLLHADLSVDLNLLHVHATVGHAINDGLMTIFRQAR